MARWRVGEKRRGATPRCVREGLSGETTARDGRVRPVSARALKRADMCLYGCVTFTCGQSREAQRQSVSNTWLCASCPTHR